MTASVAAFLDQVRERGAELPAPLSGALLLAAVRLSDARVQALRPDLIQVDSDGGLELRAGAADLESSYASPELRKGSALEHDPRVLVWAAGALGYELVTLKRLELDQAPGPEVPGPLAPVIRKALAPERRKRFRNLAEMAVAIEELQAPPSVEEERLILAAVAQTSTPRQKLARIELQKQPAPSPSPYAPDPPADAPPAETPPAVHPVFAQQWDPLEAPPEVFFAPEAAAPEPEPGVVELEEAQVREAHGQPDPFAELRAQLEAERHARREELMVLESRLENLARLGSRISAMEAKLSTPPPPAAAPDALAREVALIVDQRQAAARRPFGAALPAVGGAAAGAALALLAVVALRPRPAPVVAPPPAVVAAAPVKEVPPALPPPVLVAAPVQLPVSKPPPHAEARAEQEIPNPPPPAPAAPRHRAAPRRSPAAVEHAAQGDKALRAFNTAAAQAAFETALKEDPSLPDAHRGLGMVYVLQGKNDAAKAEYQKYLEAAPDAPDADQIKRLLAR